MPTYDIRCRACGLTFEARRPMAEADAPAPCPNGHDDTVRLLPTVALTGRVSARPAPARSGGSGSAAGAGSGGCCGGGCCSGG